MHAPPGGLNTLTNKSTVATRVKQSSSNELSPSVSDCVRCKRTEVNTYIR